MSTVKVNEVRHLSNTGSANIVLESNATTNLQATSTLGLTVTGTLTVSGVSTLNGNVVIGNATTDTVDLISTIKGFNNFSGFTGEIRMYAGNAAGDSPPAGWLYCNGNTVSSTSANGGTHYNLDGKGNDYQPLFNLLKASNDWGNASSSTWGTNTVKTPDFRSRAPVGIHTGAATSITAGLTSRTLSDAVGTETHALAIAELATHTHVMTNPAVPASQVLTYTAQTVSSATQVDHHHTLAHTHSLSGHTHPITHNHNIRIAQEWSSGHGAYSTRRVSSDYGPELTSSSAGPVSPLVTDTLNTASSTGPSTDATGGVSTPNTGNASASTVSVSLSTGAATISDPTHTHISTAATTGSGTPHTILSPIIAVNYIIKV